MAPNPYAWDKHFPLRSVSRGTLIADAIEHLRRGVAVKVIGGRGMGKSVLLQQIAAAIEPEARVIRVSSPPEEATVAGAVTDLAAKLGIRDLVPPRMDDLLERTLQGDVTRLVVLFDEADQYIALGSAEGAFARAWFNKLEATRKQWESRFDLVFAGGLGLLYLEGEIGSGLVSRAESCILAPFDAAEIASLANPFGEDGRCLTDECLDALLAFSGGSPALVTYGLEHLWDAKEATVLELERIFGVFREKNDSFVRAVRASVSHRGRLDAPWRVLEAVRGDAGAVPMSRLRDACASRNETMMVDPEQALRLLSAAGLLRVEGSMSADPVAAWPIASILNLPETPAGTGGPIDRLIQDISSVLANLRRFGRDFHGKDGLLHEDLYSSLISVGLRLLGWLETDREAVQAAGYTDVKVQLRTRPGLGGHVIIETKIWHGDAYNKGIQQQIDDYHISETVHGIAVTLGVRGVKGWAHAYEETCLTGLRFEKLETPPDLVARWRVTSTDSDGRECLTDHLLVQIPKRA